MPRLELVVPYHRFIRRSLIFVFSLFLAVSILGNASATQAQAVAAGDLVFSQVYTRGGNGDYIAAEMVKAFITSAEYRQRFGP